jgi:phenylalanyl-tRNA synthetase beta subunit
VPAQPTSLEYVFGGGLADTQQGDAAQAFQADVNAQLSELNANIADNLTTAQSYTPADSTDWDGTDPTTVSDALDRCATLLKTLNGGTGP